MKTSAVDNNLKTTSLPSEVLTSKAILLLFGYKLENSQTLIFLISVLSPVIGFIFITSAPKSPRIEPTAAP